jgi:histidyl-tRNA synthetase
MNQNQPQTLKGFRDFLPETMAIRNYVKGLLIETFETFGFQPLETPSVEYASTLMGKYGDEADKLVYAFTDQGGRAVGLRYDLTVPTAKVLAIYGNQLPLPFKRYQIQPVWRAEKPQKGRYREVLQCDIDIFGPASPINDAEIINVIYSVLNKLKFSKYSIRINSRTVLYQILTQAGIDSNQSTVLQSIDKLQKIGRDGVTNELKDKGLTIDSINRIFEYINLAQPDEYLQTVFNTLEKLKLPPESYSFDPTMVRGLDYYTGPIFETYVEEPKIGSVTGGGRYDKLVKTLGGPDIAAVGTTIGLDRIVDVIQELNLLPSLSKTKTQVLVANFSPETQSNSLDLVSQLRQSGIATVFYPYPDKLGKQFKYADALGIPSVAILGPDEVAQNKVTLKNLTTSEQKLVSNKDLLALFV